MITAKELRIGNIVTWNPRLVNPNVTLPPLQIEVYAVLPDRILYVFPNIENRVEPFEDDVVQLGERYKMLEELEPIVLTPGLLENIGFAAKGEMVGSKYFEKAHLQLQAEGDVFKRIVVSTLHNTVFDPPVTSFHQLQNLYYALHGEELDTLIHGQQA